MPIRIFAVVQIALAGLIAAFLFAPAYARQTPRTPNEAAEPLSREDVTPVAGTESHADPIADLRDWLGQDRDARPKLAGQAFADMPLSQDQAAEATRLLWEDHCEHVRTTRAGEMSAREFSYDGKVLKYELKTFGDRPAGGRSLFISMHGGGNAPARVNDQQWRNQIRLYEPEEGIYLAPRAPTDNWNLWHEPHIDPMFDRLIESFVVFEGVNPDRVYLMGYSAGGDGVYQLAPRMADRWAAAAMMAGHPNEASPLGLRNLPFALHVGANDDGFNRNQVAAEWAQKLADLQKEDSDGYVHEVRIHEGKGHWMDREDAEAVPWMARFTRNPRPKRVVWYQDDVAQSRYYWLAVDNDNRRGGTLVRAEVQGQTIDIETSDLSAITVLLDDALLDLEQPVTIRLNGRTAFEGTARRTVASLAQSLAERGDPASLFSARVSVRREDQP